MGEFAVIKVKGAVHKQKGFVLNLMCRDCLWMSVTDSVLRKSVCLAALRKGGLELHRCTPSHGYLALYQWDASLSGKDTRLSWDSLKLVQSVAFECRALFHSYPPLGVSFSTAYWMVFKCQNLYLLTICPSTWIGGVQDKNISSAILLVIIHLLLPQNRSFDLNKMHTFAVLEGLVYESILMELARRNRHFSLGFLFTC